MGVLVKSHQGNFALTGIAKLSFVGFLVAFAASFVITVWAIYLDSFLNDVSKVGLMSAFLTLVGICSFFFIIPFIEKNSKSKIFFYGLLTAAIAYLSLYFIESFYLVVLTSMIITIAGAFRLTSFGLIVRDKSKKTNLSKNEGIMFTFTNVSYVVGPLLAGIVANRFGIKSVFIIASIFFLIALVIFKVGGIKDNRKEKVVHKNILKNSLDFFKDKQRVVAYIVGGGISFWWILIYLYMPLQIIRSGLNELWVGYFLFAVPLPLILLEYKFAKLAGEKGYKRLFKIGFLIPAIASVICFFFVDNIFALMGILTLASIGLAMLEPTSEAYFFKITNKEEEQRFYGPYNTRLDVAGLIGKFIPALLLIIIPFKYVFVIFGVAMFLLFIMCSNMKEVTDVKK